MKEMITLCGDNCAECPRYNAHSEEELKDAALLWYKIGWRDRVVSCEEMKCSYNFIIAYIYTYGVVSCEEMKCSYNFIIAYIYTYGVVSCEEMKCSGCSSHKVCTYNLVECTKEHKVEKCNQCKDFPCEKISDMLKRSAEYQDKCREICSPDEYEILEKAFFDKENNLKK